MQAQDTVLHSRLDTILINRLREAEVTTELADFTLRAPELAFLALFAILGRSVGAFGATVDSENLEYGSEFSLKLQENRYCIVVWNDAT